jgi:hypothetical protein
MRFYVATKAENWPAAREVIDMIIGYGHVVTYDWTKDVEAWGPMGSAQETEPKTDAELAEFARLDIEGVATCHVNIQLPYPRLGGTLVEMGAALALNKTIWVYGDVVQWHPFYKLPQVWHMPADPRKLEARLADLNAGMSLWDLSGFFKRTRLATT